MIDLGGGKLKNIIAVLPYLHDRLTERIEFLAPILSIDLHRPWISARGFDEQFQHFLRVHEFQKFLGELFLRRLRGNDEHISRSRIRAQGGVAVFIRLIRLDKRHGHHRHFEFGKAG